MDQLPLFPVAATSSGRSVAVKEERGKGELGLKLLSAAALSHTAAVAPSPSQIAALSRRKTASAAMVELGVGILEVVVEPVPPLKTEATAAGRRPRRARTAAAIQRVFQACGAVFAAPGTVHAPAEVALLRAMLSTDEARRQFNEVNKLVLRSMRAKSLIGLIRIRVTVALHYRSERLLVCLSG